MASWSQRILFLGLVSLTAGCMGGEPAPAEKVAPQPAADRPTLAPNIIVQRKVETPDQRAPNIPSLGSSTRSDRIAPAKPTASSKPERTKPDESKSAAVAMAETEPAAQEPAEPEKQDEGAKPETKKAPEEAKTQPDESVRSTPRETAAKLTLNTRKPNLPSDLPSWFTEYDKDGDGMVGLHEWPRDRRDEFRKHDRNGDGFITIDEVMRGIARSKPAETSSSTSSVASSDDPDRRAAEGTIKRYARKQEGKLALDEMPFFYKKERFNEFDTNKDGYLDATEMTAFLKGTRTPEGDTATRDTTVAAAPNTSGGAAAPVTFNSTGGTGGNRGGFGGDRGGDRGGFGGDRGGDRGGFGGPRSGQGGGQGGTGRDPDAWARTAFDRMDTKKTGKLTKEDFPEFLRPRFEEYDTNKDGVVDFEEYKAGMARRFTRRN